MGLIYNKLFLSPYFFTIAIRKKSNESIIDCPEFISDYVVNANRNRWYADPILVDDGDKTFLFYEAFDKDRGYIEVAEIGDDCKLQRKKRILNIDCHLSYPFVFKKNSEWYMIPETSAIEEVSLYKAIDFPLKWEKQKVLLQRKSVDTTVFEALNDFFLLTFDVVEESERVKPLAFRINEEFELSRIAWTEYDNLKCRGAGPIFHNKTNLYRPAQVSTDVRYGDQIVFYKIETINGEYIERQVQVLDPQNISAENWWFDGLHTYTVSNRFEAIDIRCRKLDLLKVPRTIKNKVLQMIL